MLGSVAPVAGRKIERGGTGQWHALAASWLGEAFDAMDASLYFVAMYPALSELLRTKSEIEIGQIGSIVLAIFMLGWFFGAILFGVLADRIGRRKVMLATILIYSAATGLCALVHNWQVLAACRFVVGLGIGGEICLGTVIISEFWKGRSRLWAAALLESSFNFGLLLSSGANAMFGGMGWRLLFVVGIVPALFTLYIRSRLSESTSFEEVKAHRRRLRQVGRISVSDEAFLRSPLWQLMKPGMRERTMVAAVLGAAAVIGYWASVAWLPAWINQLTGELAVGERSFATTIFSIGGLIGCFATPGLCHWLGRRMTLMTSFGGALVVAVGMFLTVHVYGVHLLVWAFWLGILTNVQFVALQIYLPEVFPTSVLGTACGICYGAGRIFSAVLALCGGQLIAIYGGSYGMACATISGVYALGFVAALKVTATSGEVIGTLLSNSRATAMGEAVAIVVPVDS